MINEQLEKSKAARDKYYKDNSDTIERVSSYDPIRKLFVIERVKPGTPRKKVVIQASTPIIEAEEAEYANTLRGKIRQMMLNGVLESKIMAELNIDLKTYRVSKYAILKKLPALRHKYDMRGKYKHPDGIDLTTEKVLKLREEGITIREIAERLNITIGSVNYCIRKGKMY